MRKIVVASIKGGVGKTMVSSNLARSLKRLGFSVGYLDADITAPTGSEAFGLEKLPDWELDAAANGGKGAIVPYDVDGIQFITLASQFGQAPAVLWNEERKIDAARQLLQGVVAWDNLDWLVLDTPPARPAKCRPFMSILPTFTAWSSSFSPPTWLSPIS